VSTWTTSRLFRLPVHDVDGRDLGHVRDVRLDPDAAEDGLHARGLVVGDRLLAQRLGTPTGVVRGPALLAWWLRRRRSRLRWVPWDAVASLDEGGIALRVGVDALDPVPEARP
jgi:hypothetical protein